MNHLRLVENNLRPQKLVDKKQIFQRIFFQMVVGLAKRPEEYSLSEKKKAVLFGVKSFTDLYRENQYDSMNDSHQDWLDGMLFWANFIDMLIGSMTPRHFMQVFPIIKKYDGKRWDFKDYFTTIEMINRHGIDTPIGSENTSSFLWAYENIHTRCYLISKMSVLDDLKILTDGKGIMEEFLEEHGVTPRRIITGVGGETVLYNPATQKTRPISKRMPRYIKIVK